MATSFAEVADRAALLRERIERAGGSGVGIIAVTKGFDDSVIAAAVAAGLSRVGENYAQEAGPKITAARAHGLVIETHFIGQLQTNKVRLLAPVIDVWQTVDRAAAVQEIARRCPAGTRVFLQVNSTGEDTKAGCEPRDVDALLQNAVEHGLTVEGLMTMGPTDVDPARSRDAFRLTRSLVDRLGLGQCSMGMSDDLEIAVAEGSTLVRVGSALFGRRPAR